MTRYECPRCGYGVEVLGSNIPTCTCAGRQLRPIRMVVAASSPTPRQTRNRLVALGGSLAATPSRPRPRRGVGRQAGPVG